MYRAGNIMILLGYDPGSVNQGFSIVSYAVGDTEPARVIYSDTLQTPKMGILQKIQITNAYVKTLVKKYHPEVVSIEDPVFATGVGAEINRILGAAMLAFNEAQVTLFAPAEVKKIVTGNGKASKDEVAYFVDRCTTDGEFDTNHACDATACVIAYLTKVFNYGKFTAINSIR